MGDVCGSCSGTGYTTTGLCNDCGGSGFPSDAPELTPCEACEGSGRIPIGEHFVTQDMATDAGEPDMVGMSMGVEYGPCPVCNGYGQLHEGGNDGQR